VKKMLTAYSTNVIGLWLASDASPAPIAES
jgi:hypothetical protein